MSTVSRIRVIPGAYPHISPMRPMDAVLNEHTNTVHKREDDATDLHTSCGVTSHVDDHQLESMPVRRAVADRDASKCGRCFEDGGGY